MMSTNEIVSRTWCQHLKWNIWASCGEMTKGKSQKSWLANLIRLSTLHLEACECECVGGGGIGFSRWVRIIVCMWSLVGEGGIAAAPISSLRHPNPNPAKSSTTLTCHVCLSLLPLHYPLLLSFKRKNYSRSIFN